MLSLAIPLPLLITDVECVWPDVVSYRFWAGGLMEPAAPRVGLWGWFFHRNYGRTVRKVVWSISALGIVMLSPFWMVVKLGKFNCNSFVGPQITCDWESTDYVFCSFGRNIRVLKVSAPR